MLFNDIFLFNRSNNFLKCGNRRHKKSVSWMLFFSGMYLLSKLPILKFITEHDILDIMESGLKITVHDILVKKLSDRDVAFLAHSNSANTCFFCDGANVYRWTGQTKEVTCALMLDLYDLNNLEILLRWESCPKPIYTTWFVKAMSQDEINFMGLGFMKSVSPCAKTCCKRLLNVPCDYLRKEFCSILVTCFIRPFPICQLYSVLFQINGKKITFTFKRTHVEDNHILTIY